MHDVVQPLIYADFNFNNNNNCVKIMISIIVLGF